MQITLIRHLPTEWNKRTWLQGRRDTNLSPLTPELQQDIAANLKKISTLKPFDAVLASTLKRTQETALLYGYQPEIDPLLDELDFGQFEGVPKKKLLDVYKDKWLDTPSELVLGEHVKNLETRITSFLEKYKDDRHVLVFGHGSWIRALFSFVQYGHINGMNKLTIDNNQCVTITVPAERMKGRNGEINVV